jgi:hypothetical protein
VFHKLFIEKILCFNRKKCSIFPERTGTRAYKLPGAANPSDEKNLKKIRREMLARKPKSRKFVKFFLAASSFSTANDSTNRHHDILFLLGLWLCW